jgi:cytoskeletal protein CcmA (bactofilin family)
MGPAYRYALSHRLLQERENKVLQKDGFFRRGRDEGNFAKTQTTSPAPAPAATAAAPAPSSYHSSTANVSEPKMDERKEAKLVVGPQIKIKGVEISDCDTLVVEGRIEATLDSRVLEITQNGVFQGTIAVDNAEIRGRFEGELTVRKMLVIHETGKVSGKIRYAKIKVEEGAELSGEIQMTDKAANVTPAKRAA